MPEYWSWLLTGIGVTGLWLTGSGRWIGAGIGVAVQGLWVAYALTTHQYGFLVSAAAYGFVNARNVRRLLRDRRTREAAVEVRGGVAVVQTADFPPGYVPPSASLDPPRGRVVVNPLPAVDDPPTSPLPGPCCPDGSCARCSRLTDRLIAAFNHQVVTGDDGCTRCVDSCVCGVNRV